MAVERLRRVDVQKIRIWLQTLATRTRYNRISTHQDLKKGTKKYKFCSLYVELALLACRFGSVIETAV